MREDRHEWGRDGYMRWSASQFVTRCVARIYGLNAASVQEGSLSKFFDNKKLRLDLAIRVTED